MDTLMGPGFFMFFQQDMPTGGFRGNIGLTYSDYARLTEDAREPIPDELVAELVEYEDAIVLTPLKPLNERTDDLKEAALKETYRRKDLVEEYAKMLVLSKELAIQELYQQIYAELDALARQEDEETALLMILALGH